MVFNLEILRIQIAEFLATPILTNNFIHLDVWGIVHILAGFIIMGLLLKGKIFKKTKRPFVKLFLLLIIFEFAEAIIYLNPSRFNNFIPFPESNLDVTWDIILGMLGGWLRKKGL